MNKNMFYEILMWHNIIVVQIIDDHTFEIIDIYTKDGAVGYEKRKVLFSSKKELFIWLGY